MYRAVFLFCCLTIAVSSTANAESPGGKEAGCSGIGRYQLFHGEYKAFDQKSQQWIPSVGIFRIDTTTGEVKRYLNKIDVDGKYIETWQPTEVKIETR